MNIKNRLKILKDLIDRALDKYLPPSGDEPKAIHRAMRYSVFSGGKRIRPIIVLEACRACGGSTRDALAMACAVEIVHTYSLIHDDLPSMDDDDFRRGKPTSHKVFGEAPAILAGDALLTLAFNILAAHCSPKKGITAIKELSDAIGTYGMVGGQVMDIACKGKKMDTDKRNNVNKLKTARLFESSARLGAIAAGASVKKEAAMAGFGLAMGAAFQTIDDIMDKELSVVRMSGKRARAEAENATAAAIRKLEMFGRRADTLKRIAEYLLNRTT